MAFAIHGVLLLQSHAGLPDEWGMLLEQFKWDDRRRADSAELARVAKTLLVFEIDWTVVEGQELVMLYGFLCRTGPKSVTKMSCRR